MSDMNKDATRGTAAGGNVIDFQSAARRAKREPGETTLIYDPKPDSVGVELSEEKDGTAHLTITVPGDRVDDALELAHQALAHRFGIDPNDDEGMAGLRARLGDVAFDSLVTVYVQQHFFAQAIMRVEIMPFLQPEFLDDDLPHSFVDYRFRADVLIRPEIELSSYEPVSVVFPPRHEVTDEDVDGYLDYMARSLAAMDAAEHGGDAGAGGAGAGTGADVPPLLIDDAWVRANMPEAGSLEGLRGRVRAMLEHQAQQEWRGELEMRCARELAKRLASEPGEPYLQKTVESVEDNRIEEMRARGVDPQEAFGGPHFDRASWDRAIRAEAVETLRRSCALDALADHLDIDLTQQDILRAYRETEPNADAQSIVDVLNAGQMHRLCEVALRMRAGDWLVETAKPKSTADLHVVK